MGSHRPVQHRAAHQLTAAVTVAGASFPGSSAAASPAAGTSAAASPAGAEPAASSPSAAAVDLTGRPAARNDRGSAPVDFVLIGALTTVLFVAVLQLALALHVRATLVDCAAEGARYGALADRTPADGAARARQLIGMSLAPRYADDVVASIEVHDGLEVVEVRVRAPLPVLGLIGPGTALTVDGHALREATA